MIKILFLYAALSCLGWIWVIMGISTLRDHRKVREQERARTTAKVVELIPEEVRRWNSHRHRHETCTVWHPVVTFSVENREYRLKSSASLLWSDLSVGETVDICYDADDPTHFHFEKLWEDVSRRAKGFIIIGIVWAVIFSPFLLNRVLNG